jgi:hypothetical protein
MNPQPPQGPGIDPTLSRTHENVIELRAGMEIHTTFVTDGIEVELPFMLEKRKVAEDGAHAFLLVPSESGLEEHAPRPKDPSVPPKPRGSFDFESLPDLVIPQSAFSGVEARDIIDKSGNKRGTEYHGILDIDAAIRDADPKTAVTLKALAARSEYLAKLKHHKRVTGSTAGFDDTDLLYKFQDIHDEAENLTGRFPEGDVFTAATIGGIRGAMDAVRRRRRYGKSTAPEYRHSVVSNPKIKHVGSVDQLLQPDLLQWHVENYG